MIPEGIRVFAYNSAFTEDEAEDACAGATALWLRAFKLGNRNYAPSDAEARRLQKTYLDEDGLDKKYSIGNTIMSDYYSLLSHVGIHVRRQGGFRHTVIEWKEQLRHVTQRTGSYYCKMNGKNAHCLGFGIDAEFPRYYFFDGNEGLFLRNDADKFVDSIVRYITLEYPKMRTVRIMECS